MGSGIDLTKVCKDGVGFRRPGRRMGKGRRVPRDPASQPNPGLCLSSPSLGREGPTVHLKKGSFPSLLRRGGSSVPLLSFPSRVTSSCPQGWGLFLAVPTSNPTSNIWPFSFSCVYVCGLYLRKFASVCPEPVLKLCSLCHFGHPTPTVEENKVLTVRSPSSDYHTAERLLHVKVIAWCPFRPVQIMFIFT